MKFYQRIISICMSLLLLLGALPMQVLAADLKGASEHSVSMSNKYIKVVVNKDNGRFAIRTVDGQPLRKNDQNANLTFDEDDTSFTTFRIDDGTYTGEYIFGNDYDLNGGNNLKTNGPLKTEIQEVDGKQVMTTVWTLTLTGNNPGTIEITQKITLNASTDTDNSGMVFIDYSVKSSATDPIQSPIKVSTRVLLDTMVGTNDGPAFQNGATQENVISVERTLLRDPEGEKVDGTQVTYENAPNYTIQNYWMMRDNGSKDNPLSTSVYAYGFNNVATDDVNAENVEWNQGNLADKLIVGHWAHLANSKFDVDVKPSLNFTTDTNDYGTADSALAYFWDEKTVEPKGTQSYRVVYGLGQILTDDSEFQISFIDQKSQLETNDAKTAYLNRGVFEITVQVQCSEQSKITQGHSMLTATMTLENGLSFVETRNGQIVYDSVTGMPKTTGNQSQTRTYTKPKTSDDQVDNPFKAGDMCVFKYTVVAEGKAWPTTKEYMFQVTSDELKGSITAGRTNPAYAEQEVSCSRSDFILLPAIGTMQQSRAYSLAPEQAYYADEKIISVGVTNFGAYSLGNASKSGDTVTGYPDRNFDVYLRNALTGDRYLVHPTDISLVDKDGANGVMNIDFTDANQVDNTVFDPNPQKNEKPDPTLPVGSYAVEVIFRGGNENSEERTLLSFTSDAQISVNTSQEARLRTGGFLTVARRYKQANSAEYASYTKIIDALYYAGHAMDTSSEPYKVQKSGTLVPYYEVKIHANEAALNEYKKDINSVTTYDDKLGWTTENVWSNGEVLLEIKGKVKEQNDGYLVDTSVEPAVINRTVTYSGTALTLNKELLAESFKNNDDFVKAYAKAIAGVENGYSGLNDVQKGNLSSSFELEHWTLAGEGKLSISGAKYTFYNKKWNIDFFDGMAKTLFLNDRIDEYSDRFDDSNVYNVSNLTATQNGFKEHANGLVSEQANPYAIMVEGDVYVNQLGLVPKQKFNPGSMQLTLADYRLASYHGSYRVNMGGYVNFSIFEGTVDDVSYDTKGFYGVDANCGFDIWKNIGILQAVGNKYYSEGYDASKADTTNQVASSGRAAEAGAALLVRHYRADANEIDNIYAFSSKFKLPVIGGMYVGFVFKEVDNGMIMPDCFAFQYFAKSSSTEVATGAADAAKERQAIPGIQIGPNLYMTRVRAMVRNLADTVYGMMTGENVGSLPLQLGGGITVSMPMGLGTVASRVAIIGNIDMLLKMTGLKITGSMELELWLVSFPLVNLAEFQLQWCSPAFVSAKIWVDIFDLGILVGKGAIFIGERENGDFDFEAYISAAVMIPKKVPAVGGLSLAKAYFGVSLESITGGFTILPFVMVNLEYFWGGGIDDINFWVSTDGTPKEEALAYLIHTDEESGQQSILSIGKNIAYVATSDYDPENAGQKLVYRGTEGADELLIYRSAGLGGITVDDKTYTVPLGAKIYDSNDPANALVEMEYFDELPQATNVTLGGESYSLKPYEKDTNGDWITPDDAATSEGRNLYYYTQERDMDGTTQKMMYITVPYEKLSSNSTLVLTLDQNVDMALLRVGRGATLDSVELQKTEVNNAVKSITMKADVTNAKKGGTVKFFLTQSAINAPAETEDINGHDVKVDDLGTMGMLVDEAELPEKTGTQTASVTIENVANCTILDKANVNLHELLESGDYYLRAVLDTGDMQDVKQTDDYITLTDPKAPKPVTDAKLELGGNGQLKVSFKPDDTGDNKADAFVLNFYQADGSDWPNCTDVLVNRSDMTKEDDGVLSYTFGTWTEMVQEKVIKHEDGTETVVEDEKNPAHFGFEPGREYQAKVKAACSEEIDGEMRYHYSELTKNYAKVSETTTKLRLPEPKQPTLAVTGATAYYKHADGDYRTEKNAKADVAYYSLSTNKAQPELTITSDVNATLKVYNGSEKVRFNVKDGAANLEELTLSANTATTIRLLGFDDADVTTSLLIFAQNTETKDSGFETLRLVTDHTAPTLYIDSPVNGTASVNGSVSFSGMTNATDSVVKVYVDGSETGTTLTVDADGNLSGNVPLNTAKPTAQLRVVATDAAGNTNAAEITVQNGSYKVAQNIVMRSFKSGNKTMVETVGRFANGKDANGAVVYSEESVSDVKYSTYRGDATASPDGTVTFGTTDASIIEATYDSPDGATLKAMTVVRKDNAGVNPNPGGGNSGGNSGGSGGGGGAGGGGAVSGGGAAVGGGAAATQTVKESEAKTTVNNKSVEVAVTTDTKIVTIDATGSGDKTVKTEFAAAGYAIEYTSGSALNVDTPIFKAELTADTLGNSGTVTVSAASGASATVAGSSVVSATSVDLGGSGDLKTPVKVSVAIPDTASVNDVTAVILRDKSGKVTPLPYTLNMIGDTAYVDVLLPDEGEIILEKCQTGFTDVTSSNWAYEEIMAAAEREIINGVADGVFDRTSSCTRSAFATILMRTGGMMTRETSTALPDVPKGAWDYQALAVAKDLGVISGFEDGTIRGGNSVSRTEAMVMVGRFLSAMGAAQQLSDSEVEEQLKAFTDAAAIPSWARSSVALCVKAGIINGMDGAVNGNGRLTREQCAAIANRLNRVIVENLLTK